MTQPGGKTMTMTLKETELVAVATSVAAGCKPCTNYHLLELRKAGASDEEIRHAIATAISIRRGATDTIEAHGLKYLNAGGGIPDAPRDVALSRADELMSIGAAFAVSCTSTLDKHLSRAERAGIKQEEVRGVAELAAFVKRMAASHVEKLVGVETDTDARHTQREAGCNSCS